MSSDKTPTQKMIQEGISYAKLGKHKNAISFFDQSLKQDPQNIEALYNKGMSLLELKEKQGRSIML